MAKKKRAAPTRNVRTVNDIMAGRPALGDRKKVTPKELKKVLSKKVKPKTVADEIYGRAGAASGNFVDTLIESNKKTTLKAASDEAELLMEAIGELAEELGETALLTDKYED